MAQETAEQWTCPFCRAHHPPLWEPHLRDMTLGEAWVVLKHAATITWFFLILTAIPLGAWYWFRGSLAPLDWPEAPLWLGGVLWTAVSVALYFALPNIALSLGAWLVHAGDVWKRVSYACRVIDAAVLGLLALGFIYKPLITWIVMIPISSTLWGRASGCTGDGEPLPGFAVGHVQEGTAPGASSRSTRCAASRNSARQVLVCCIYQRAARKNDRCLMNSRRICVRCLR
jgi:hypothetical protein